MHTYKASNIISKYLVHIAYGCVWGCEGDYGGTWGSAGAGVCVYECMCNYVCACTISLIILNFIFNVSGDSHYKIRTTSHKKTQSIKYIY